MNAVTVDQESFWLGFHMALSQLAHELPITRDDKGAMAVSYLGGDVWRCSVAEAALAAAYSRPVFAELLPATRRVGVYAVKREPGPEVDDD